MVVNICVIYHHQIIMYFCCFLPVLYTIDQRKLLFYY